MRHVRKISLAKASVGEKDMDPAGMVFIQIWASVMSMILVGAFGGKR